ncbi:MAG: hypothetical protein ABI335_30620 [Polyangiaceae bacterium]
MTVVSMSMVKRSGRRSQHPQTVLGNDRFELLALIRSEATQIIVERIDARHRPASQVLEQRVVGEPLEVEHPSRSDHRRVNKQLDLGVHRIDDLLACLEMTEVSGKLPTQPLALRKGVEVDEPADPRQARVVSAPLQLPHISTPNSAARCLPVPARCPLASQRRSSHLLGARSV